jgi:glucose/arabinose dehydrogenase/PKD repeat protein
MDVGVQGQGRRVVRGLRALTLAGVLVLAAWLVVTGPALAAVPAGFEDTQLTTFDGAMSLAFTPDGRMLIGGRTGQLRVYQNGTLSAPALDLRSRLCWDGERGMVGLAVDPDFASNHHIYIYYSFDKYHDGSGALCKTFTANGPVNRLSRFTLGSSNVVDPASEVVLLDNIPSYTGYHNAGDIGFGEDGYLYVSVGDGQCDYAGDSGCQRFNDAARDRNVVLGKILRITPGGGIPVDNPFTGANSGRCNQTGRTDPGKSCQETYAWGLRNPFRFAFDPAGTRFFINDTGDDYWEEIDLGTKGADYGWNVREGHCAISSYTNCGAPPAGMTNPIFDYPHTSGCTAITGGAFVPQGAWPAAYDGGYLFGDYTCGKIRLLKPSGSTYTASDFASGLGPVIDLVFGPYGSKRALYYTTWKSPVWEVHRIAATSGNRAPVADAKASPSAGTLPLAVAFDGSGSSDPDGDALTYDWDFGDGSAHSTVAKPSHSYTTAGTYTAKLTVKDPSGATGTATVRIDAGNRPPVPRIDSPPASVRFRVGDPIDLRGGATDPEDGTLAASRLSWEVVLHHNQHIHPFLAPTSGNDVAFPAPSPENLSAAVTSYLEIRMTATDSKGLSTTITQDLRPHLVDLTFTSDPSGLKVNIDGTVVTTPATFTSWEGYRFTVLGVGQSSGGFNGVTYWVEGGPSREIVTPASPATYKAGFARCGGGLGTSLILLGLCGLPYARRRRLRGHHPG